jgi:endonuclease G
MMVTGTPSRPANDFIITGAPMLPDQLPSAVAALQWAGWPGFDNIRFRQGYLSSFNRMTKNPNWVCQHLCKEVLEGEGKRAKGKEPFAEDPKDPAHMRSTLNDYRGSGFDRGHMFAAADIKFSQTALEETFFLSNICPQVGEGFNRGYWCVGRHGLCHKPPLPPHLPTCHTCPLATLATSDICTMDTRPCMR